MFIFHLSILLLLASLVITVKDNNNNNSNNFNDNDNYLLFANTPESNLLKLHREQKSVNNVNRAFFHACKIGDTRLVTAILENIKQVDYNYGASDIRNGGQYCLTIAAANGHHEIVDLILSRKRFPKSATLIEKENVKLVKEAIENQHEKIISLFLINLKVLPVHLQEFPTKVPFVHVKYLNYIKSFHVIRKLLLLIFYVI